MTIAMNYSPETIQLIEELIDNSYHDQDMYDFIEQYGENNFRSYYTDFVDIGEKYSYEAADAFIAEFSIDDISNFEDAYYGEFSWDDFVESYASDNVLYRIPEDLQCYFDMNAFSADLAYDYIENGGFIFSRNW